MRPGSVLESRQYKTARLGGAIPAGLALLFGLAGAAQADPAWIVENRAAKQARDQKDWAAYKQHLLALRPLLSGHPRVVYSLAQAEALLGNPKAALEILGAFAATGLARDAKADPDLATLWALPEAEAVLQRLAENAKPVARGATVVTMPDADLLTEDLAHDPGTRRTYVSSIRKRKILVVEPDGGVRDFVASGQDGIGGVFGLALDGARGVLWATANTVPQAEGYSPAAKSKPVLLCYELASGRLTARHELQADGEPSLAELAVAPDGTVYVSESAEGGLYVLRPGSKTLEPLGLPAGELASPQGLALSPDARRLFVADYVRGIASVELATKQLSWLGTPESTAVNGIDGLILAGAEMFAVQNGTDPRRILRLRLDVALDRIEAVDILESGVPDLGEPTHAVLVDGALQVLANTGWDRVAEDGSMKSDAATKPATLRRIELPAR